MSTNRGQGRAYAWIVAHKDYDGDDCLIWPFARLPHGRGVLGYNGKVLYAHRVMCELVKGPCPEGLICAHSCGRGHDGCVNQNHLSWKTPTDNHLDQRKHGTHVTTRCGSHSKLSREQVLEMRVLIGIETNAQTAKRFGCSEETIRYWRYADKMPRPLGQSRGARDRRARKQAALQALSHSPC